MRKSPKHEPTESYLFIERNISMSMIRFNFHVGPVRTQMTKTQRMNNSDMSKKNIPNLRIYYMGKSESKRIKGNESKSRIHSTDKSESKMFVVNACYRK